MDVVQRARAGLRVRAYLPHTDGDADRSWWQKRRGRKISSPAPTKRYDSSPLTEYHLEREARIVALEIRIAAELEREDAK